MANMLGVRSIGEVIKPRDSRAFAKALADLVTRGVIEFEARDDAVDIPAGPPPQRTLHLTWDQMVRTADGEIRVLGVTEEGYTTVIVPADGDAVDQQPARFVITPMYTTDDAPFPEGA